MPISKAQILQERAAKIEEYYSSIDKALKNDWKENGHVIVYLPEPLSSTEMMKLKEVYSDWDIKQDCTINGNPYDTNYNYLKFS